ncbi:MAG: asparagine synthase (glutamine-hydrolyzing) [Blastocatellia bacterium]|nr:asparagine synthase (glutamine-hydrolyzing) [Blastocatellia bacterium]
MCGIAGFIGNRTEADLNRMLDAVRHRGPDDRGTYVKRERHGALVGLGQQRLSILDLSSAGHNPMPNSARNRWLVYNGETYNFREIRQELATKGHRFHSECDTEVILAANDEWGIRHLDRLNGMFAYAVWDETTDTLLLVRDRLGIKPLYYVETADGIAFGSEIKSLLTLPGVKAELDQEALHEYLTFLWVPDPKTAFRGIRKLPPGHYLTWNNGTLTIKQYWDIHFQEDFSRSQTYWEATLREQLRLAVERQLVSDVPLGAFLSGGVDSSSIVGLMTRRFERDGAGRTVQTYTMGSSAEDLAYDVNDDDTEYARQVGKLFHTDYHESLLQPDVINLLPKMVWHMDEPVADPAILTSYLICRAARETLTVMLSGMGADEVFAGYPRHLAAVRLAKLFNLVPQRMSEPLVALLPGAGTGTFGKVSRNVKKLAKSAGLPFDERYLGYGTYFTDAEKMALYAPELQAATVRMDAYHAHRTYLERVKGEHPVNQMLYLDFKTFLPCLNLTYSDKTSMAASVEVRVPFLDHTLVELSAQMPADLKLHGTTRKYILKKCLQDLLPKNILYRKKAGFSAPVRAWLRRDLREMVDDLLSETTLKRRGLFNPTEVRRLIEAQRQGREDNALKIYQLLTLELWLQTFVDKKQN